MKEKTKILLGAKTKIELQNIAKDIGIKGFYKLSKKEILLKIIEFDDRKKLKETLGIKSNLALDKKYWFALIIPLLAAFYFFYNSASKQDINTVIEIVDKNEQYIKEIEFLEKYKKKFLEEGMNLGYKVFGIKDGLLVTTYELKNPNLKSEYISEKIQMDFDKNIIEVDILVQDLELVLPKGLQRKSYFTNTRVNQKFPLIEDNFYKAGGISQDGNGLLFVILKIDREQPVYAIGLSGK